MENKTFTIEATDTYGDQCLGDAQNGNQTTGRKPEGFVEIYEQNTDGSGTKKLVGKSNLVLYVGREWLATRIFNTVNGNITGTPDQFISWVGLGDNGTMPGDPLIPVPPTNGNTGLNSEVMINASDATMGDYRGTGTVGYYKHPFDSVTFEEDGANDSANLVCKVTVTIEADDANGNNLSEAGLFVASTSAGGHTGPFDIFARITFPAIVKTTDRRLIFVWYVYV